MEAKGFFGMGGEQVNEKHMEDEEVGAGFQTWLVAAGAASVDRERSSSRPNHWPSQDAPSSSSVLSS